MAKIIDPDNYVPHNLPIPGIEKAQRIDGKKYPAGLLANEEAEAFNRFVKEMREESKAGRLQPWI